MSETMTERYAELAREFANKTPVELATALDKTDKDLDEASHVKALLETRKDFLRAKLAERMTEEGITALGVDGVGRFRIQDEMYVSAAGTAKENIIAILKDTGNGGMVKEDINAATFKAFVKRLSPEEDGMPNPVLSALMGAGMALRVVPLARRY